MSNCCIKDDVLIAQYFEGNCTAEQSKKILHQISDCPDCQSHFAQLASLLAQLDESEADGLRVPNELTQSAMSLFDSIHEKPGLLAITVKIFNRLLTPMDSDLVPVGAHSLRGAGDHAEDLTYHLTVGQFALAVELNSADAEHIDLSVRPLQAVEPGWTIRLIKGEATQRLASFDREGIQVDALAQGLYTVSLEHKQQDEHQFQLRLVSKDD